MYGGAMSIQLIIAAVIAVASFGSAWTIQDWRFGAKEADRDRQNYEATLESQRLAHRAQTQDDQRVIAAQNAALPKLNALRESVASLRDAYVGLSHESAEAVSRAQQSHEACIVTATAQKSVLDQCTERYGSLAAKAQGHVIDIETLEAAWPKCRAE
jgi:hypothetical protein